MARPGLLTEEQIEDKISEMHLWKRDKNKIVREISAANFVAAVGIVNSIAIIAETIDHHPDLLIYGWNKLRITLTTDDKGGLTQLDFDLATKIDNLKF